MNFNETLELKTGGGVTYKVTFNSTLSFRRFKQMSDAEQNLNEGKIADRLELMGEVVAEHIEKYEDSQGNVVEVKSLDDIRDMRLIPAAFSYLSAPLK